MSEFEHTLQGRFLRGLALSGDRDAIRTAGRGITYAEVHRLALTWAGSLLRACDEPPRAIGVLAGKGLESYVGILTALYCGVPAVPLQPDFPIDRTRQMLKAANCSALVTDERGYRLLPDLFETARMPVLRPAAGSGAGSGHTVPVQARFGLDEPCRVGALDIAYILFTSGSTGRPKGVLLTHANLDHYFRELAARYNFGPDDVFSQVFDPAFDCAIFDLFAAWGAGGTLVSVPGPAYRAMTDFVTAEGITVWYSTPAAISVVARRGGLRPGSMPTLRLSTFAGDALKAVDAAAWQEAAPASILDNLYGPAETTITCTVYRWSSQSSGGECVNGIVPIGSVHGGHDYILLDSGGGESAVEGELCVSGPQVTPGYLDPEDNKERFFVRRSRRWYRTGDRMRLARNGDLKFLGRIDSQVQIQGWRTELTEIDHCVRRCRGVQDAATVAAMIDDKLQLVVFYTGTPTTSAEFTRQLLKMLPQQMLPRHYQHLEAMPLSVNAKVDRQAMKRHALELFSRPEADTSPGIEVHR
jgi:amino acid adenylation domain-containing protein